MFNTTQPININGIKSRVNWRKSKRLFKKSCRSIGAGVVGTKKVLTDNRLDWPSVDKLADFASIRTVKNWL